MRLPPENVEVLRRRRRIRDIHVVLGARLQEPLETRARMLRTLSFVAMRKQQHDRRILSPLRAIGDDELIDDRLRDVHEIAELCFPQHERIVESPC